MHVRVCVRIKIQVGYLYEDVHVDKISSIYVFNGKATIRINVAPLFKDKKAARLKISTLVARAFG